MSVLDRLRGAALTIHEGIQRAMASGVPATIAEHVAKEYGPEAIHLLAAAAQVKPGIGAVAAHVIDELGTAALAALVDHLEAEKAAKASETTVPVSDGIGVSESASVSEVTAPAGSDRAGS